MRRLAGYILFVCAAVLILMVWVWARGSVSDLPEHLEQVDRPARIHPDYNGVTIPPNIAPLNFRIREQAARYRIRLAPAGGSPTIDLQGRSADVILPMDRWRALLAAARGGQIGVDILTADKDGRWRQYRGFQIAVAEEPIDSHVAYRLLRPVYNFYSDLGIYQRNLETYRQSLILHGRQYDRGCLNCHSFRSNDPNRMLLGVRSMQHGNITLLADSGRVRAIGAPFGDTAWHPSGKLAAFSRYDVRMFFHTAATEVRDVIEMDSLLGYYRVEDHRLATVAPGADKERLETMPVWSPDGRYLYFISAPKLWTDDKTVPPERFQEIRYDLVRAAYDVDSDAWGPVEMVLSAEQTGQSILSPRFTPDGRFIVVTMCDYSCFPIYRPESDLYRVDAATGHYERLSCNSERTDSWHSISSNGRWIIFSSKRDDGVFTRLYIARLDENGKTSKPFIMPQKDPGYYDGYLKVYNLPEFITGPVTTPHKAFVRAVRGGERLKVDALTAATPKVDSSPEFWRPRDP